MMKKIYASLLTLTFVLPIHASDFVSHKHDQPQVFNTNAPIQIVNFWATWCVPCRKEMPAMSQWYQQKGKKQSIQLIGIALDSKENVSKFLSTLSVTYPIWRYTGNNSRAMMKTFGNKVGALPYTVVRAPKCQAQQALIGEIDATKLDKAIAEIKTKCAS